MSLSATVEAAASRIEGVRMERKVVNAAVKFASSDRVYIYTCTVEPEAFMGESFHEFRGIATFRESF